MGGQSGWCEEEEEDEEDEDEDEESGVARETSATVVDVVLKTGLG